MTKDEARKIVYERQHILDDDERKLADQSIRRQIKSSKMYQGAKRILCYMSMEGEVDTLDLIRDALRQGKRIGVPICLEPGRMDVREITSLEDVQKGAYGIMEPKEDCPPMAKAEIDFGIIPCVSVDRIGHRLGHGAGYYDRYLAGTVFPKVAICYRKLMLEEIPVEDYDVLMDQVVYEES